MNEDFSKMLEEMKQKAIKYDLLAGRYVELARTVKNFSEELEEMSHKLEEISREIDPLVNMGGSGKKERREKTSKKHITDEIYSKIMQGSHVDRAFIEKAYTELTKQDISYVMTTIGSMPNIARRKEGRSVIFFAKNSSMRE